MGAWENVRQILRDRRKRRSGMAAFSILLFWYHRTLVPTLLAFFANQYVEGRRGRERKKAKHAHHVYLLPFFTWCGWHSLKRFFFHSFFSSSCLSTFLLVASSSYLRQQQPHTHSHTQTERRRKVASKTAAFDLPKLPLLNRREGSKKLLWKKKRKKEPFVLPFFTLVWYCLGERSLYFLPLFLLFTPRRCMGGIFGDREWRSWRPPQIWPKKGLLFSEEVLETGSLPSTLPIASPDGSESHFLGHDFWPDNDQSQGPPTHAHLWV